MVLIIILVVLAILVVGGVIARNRQLARSRPAFERALSKVEHDFAEAAATDRGWDRANLEAAARRVCADQFGTEPSSLTLVEVIDKPGTDEDQAVFDVVAGADHHRVI